MTFESLTLMPFCLEKTSIRKMVFLGFSGAFGGLLVGIRYKICKNNDDTRLFHYVSLGRCLNTKPNGLVFKQLCQHPANVNA